jgi:hypothetical protein
MATAVSTNAPWGPQQGPLQFGFTEARRLYNQGGPQVYRGSTVAPFSGNTQAGLNQIADTARAGTPVADSAQNQVNATLQGDYLNSNPYLDAMYNNAASAVTRNYSEAVAPSIQANFGLAGRGGSNSYFNALDSSQQQLGQQLGGMAANIYGGNYANERSNQMAAAQMAPGTAQLNYYDASQLLNAGGMQDTYNQNVINDKVNRFNQQQNRPWDALGRYNSMINGQYGGVSTQPQYGGGFAQNLGIGLGALGGFQELGGLSGIRNMFGFGP